MDGVNFHPLPLRNRYSVFMKELKRHLFQEALLRPGTVNDRAFSPGVTRMADGSQALSHGEHPLAAIGRLAVPQTEGARFHFTACVVAVPLPEMPFQDVHTA